MGSGVRKVCPIQLFSLKHLGIRFPLLDLPSSLLSTMSIAKTLLFNVLYVCVAVTSFELGMKKAQSGAKAEKACETSSDPARRAETDEGTDEEEPNWREGLVSVRRFEGTLGDEGITLLITEREHSLNPLHREYDASYHFHRSGIPIELRHQEEPRNDDTLRPLEFLEEGDQGGTWSIHVGEEVAKGTWSSKDGKRKLPINLREAYPPGSVKVDRLRLDFSCVEEIGRLRRGKQMSVTLLSVPGGKSEALSSRLALLARDSIDPDDQAEATPEALRAFIRAQVTRAERDVKTSIYRDNRDFTLRMNESGFLTVQEYNHVYEGGAHGYGFNTFWNLDIATGIPLKLDDLVNPGYQEKWAALGRAAILKQHNLPPGTSLEKAGLFQDQLELNTNWFIVPGGIGFRYSPSWVSGCN